MNMSQYLADLSADLGGIGKVELYNWIFEDYELVIFNGEYYVKPIGRYYDENNIKHGGLKERGEIQFSNPEILFSLVNLGKEIEEKQAFLDELSLSDDVINWCKKFGIPYEEKYFSENYVENGQTGWMGFRLKNFKRRISILYGLFNIWYGLIYDDFKRVIEFSPLLNTYDKNKDLNEQIKDWKSDLAFNIEMEMNTSLGIKYNEKSNKFVMVPSTNNLISVAYFQFSMLMTMTGTGNGAKFCSQCGKLFEIEHGNKKICPQCHKEYHRIYMQNKRMKK